MPRKIWPPKAPQPGKGFSLVEVIFAASLLSLVMLMMFNLYPSSLLTIRQAEHRLEATAKAQSILEQDRANAFSLIATIASASPGAANQMPNPMSSNFPAIGADGVQYIADRTISDKSTPPTAAGSPARLVSDMVQMYWNERTDNPDPTQYKSWHSITQELWICDIKR